MSPFVLRLAPMENEWEDSLESSRSSTTSTVLARADAVLTSTVDTRTGTDLPAHVRRWSLARKFSGRISSRAAVISGV